MIEEVTDGIYLVLGANKGRFPWSHSILAAGDINVLFDTGTKPDVFWANLKKLHLRLDEVDIVVLSQDIARVAPTTDATSSEPMVNATSNSTSEKPYRCLSLDLRRHRLHRGRRPLEPSG